MNKIQIIVLAGGRGKRMTNNTLPKVLIPFKGKPIIQSLLYEIKKSGYSDKPVIVVGQKADLIMQTLGDNYVYVYQKEQLGTGNAVSCSEKLLKNKYENIMVLYGDHPFLRAQSIVKMIKKHLTSDNTLTLATVKVKNFAGFRKTFIQWGRIIRNKESKITEIVEYRDADNKQKIVIEVNPSFFCFNASWLWKNLKKLTNNNAVKEYYLTDLVKLGVSQKVKIASVEIEAKEAYGINTSEQLKQALTLS